MYQLLILFFISFFLSSCSENSVSTYKKELLPDEITIIKKGGVSIRETSDSDSQILSVAHEKYSYKVIDGTVGYYKIKLVDGNIAWIVGREKSNWTTIIEDNKVKVLHKGGITARLNPYDNKSKVLGLAADGFSFPILDAHFSRYKILVPDKKPGWIYAGKYDEPWIINSNEAYFQDKYKSNKENNIEERP